MVRLGQPRQRLAQILLGNRVSALSYTGYETALDNMQHR
jgi:hypothetical protein